MTEFTSEFISNWRNAIKVITGVRGEMREVEKFALEALDHIERLQDLMLAYENDLVLVSVYGKLKRAEERIEELEGENSRLSVLLHDEMNQLELTIDLSNKRWIALNNIYTNGEKHNANWCKRKAQEGLGIK
jgi:hypothetical protein